MDQLTQGLSARAMATAVALDPQFTLPARPRRLDHLVVVPMTDGLVVEGTGERQVLRGRAATDLVPALLPLLDGTRGIDELATALGRRPGHVYAAVALLYACGLVEDSAGAPAAPAGVPAAVAAQLGRHLDTTRVHRSGAAALARLAAARVSVVGAGAAELASTLTAAGVRVVNAGHLDAGADLVIVVGDAPDLVATVERHCGQTGAPWLRTAHTAAGIELGPRFEAGQTACYRCFAREWRPGGPVTPPDPARRRAWYALVVDEVVALLSRVGTTRSTAGVGTVDLDAWEDRSVLVPRRPDCDRCFPVPSTDDDPPLAYRYEQAVAFPPRHLLNPKDHQHHYRPANLALQRLSKTYPSARHVPLPPADREPGPTGLSLTTLAALLARTAGRRGAVPAAGKVQRWAPTGGNLGSVQLYLAAAGVDGLAPGWYCYEAAEHRLAFVRDTTAAPVADDRLTPAPPALLVLTGALDRVARKYLDFAYRIVHLDAGVATAQLQAVARGYGVETRLAHHWDDALLHERLRLNPDDEPVTAVVGLYGKERR